MLWWPRCVSHNAGAHTHAARRIDQWVVSQGGRPAGAGHAEPRRESATRGGGSGDGV